MTILECSNVTVRYGDVVAVDSLDLSLSAGETLAILGPSGSGKTSLLYAIAGLLDIASGSIELDSNVVSALGQNVRPELRRVGLVFQNYALWPHMAAVDIVAYPLRRAGIGKVDARARATQILGTVGIDDLASRRPSELSGGQQQRVGLARAIARDALIYLFDEPTAHLDASAKIGTIEEIRRRTDETGAAAIYATHDSAEALAIADRVALMRAGRIVQIDTAASVYERPIDLDAAILTGPASALRVVSSGPLGNDIRLDVAGVEVLASTDVADRTGDVNLLVRPEWVTLGGAITGEVLEVRFTGPHTDYRILTRAGALSARVAGPPRLRVGEETGVTVERGWVPDTW